MLAWVSFAILQHQCHLMCLQQYIMSYVTNKIEYISNILIFNRQSQTIHMLFFRFENWIWYCTNPCTCMPTVTLHWSQESMLQSQIRNYIQKFSFVRVAHKIFSNWSNVPYLSTQHQFFMACNHVHWKWDALSTQAPTFLDTSWRCRTFIETPFEKCWKMVNGIQI